MVVQDYLSNQTENVIRKIIVDLVQMGKESLLLSLIPEVKHANFRKTALNEFLMKFLKPVNIYAIFCQTFCYILKNDNHFSR